MDSRMRPLLTTGVGSPVRGQVAAAMVAISRLR